MYGRTGHSVSHSVGLLATNGLLPPCRLRKDLPHRGEEKRIAANSLTPPDAAIMLKFSGDIASLGTDSPLGAGK
jgi:hypothetical protein